MESAFLFSGQGSQYVGMTKDLLSDFPQASLMMEEACDIAGFHLDKICADGPAELLKETRYTQPALFIHEAILWNLAKEYVDPIAFAGHSLGEYSALYAAGVLSFRDACSLVVLRGSIMFKAGEKQPGTMFAVIGLEDQKVEQLCQELSGNDGIIVAANYNSPGQIVLSGNAEYLRAQAPLFKSAGARMVTELQVSGAFHSPLMGSASDELGKAIESTVFNMPNKPVYPNVHAQPISDQNQLKQNLLQQLTSPVRWSQTIQNMYSSGIKNYCEIGPGKVLQGLVKRSITASDLVIQGIDTSHDIKLVQGI